MSKLKFRSAYSLAPRSRVDFEGCEPRTKQSFREACDVNRIVANYSRTGLLTHVARGVPEYGHAPAVDFHRAMNIVAEANSMFLELPGKIRQRYRDPGAFLEALEDPDQVEELRELGVFEKESNSGNGSHAEPSATESRSEPAGDTKAKPSPSKPAEQHGSRSDAGGRSEAKADKP